MATGDLMTAAVGKRYVAASGAEIIITKGSSGSLSDGDEPLSVKDETNPLPANSAVARKEPVLQLGKRYRSADGEVELLVIKPGVCDLRYDGEPMHLLSPKILPSAD